MELVMEVHDRKQSSRNCLKSSMSTLPLFFMSISQNDILALYFSLPDLSTSMYSRKS